MTSPAPASTPPLPDDALAMGLGSFDDVREDPELAELPGPPKHERYFTAAVMVVTMLAALAMVVALRGEITYALLPHRPLDVGNLAKATPGANLAERYVTAQGLLSTTQALRYERPMEGDSFRLAPIAGNQKVWVEVRVPEGMEGPRYTPPSHFAGRLVPLKGAGIRHYGLAGSLKRAGLKQLPADAWLLVDGASPRASRWALVLAGVFLYFAIWNGLGLYRLLGKVKDRREPQS